MELHVNHFPRNSFSTSYFHLKKKACVIDIGEGQQWNRARRIHPKSRALVTSQNFLKHSTFKRLARQSSNLEKKTTEN